MDLREVYRRIPLRYESTNHVLTAGLDMIWRRRAADLAGRAAGEGPWLDLCSGTGESARQLSRVSPPGTAIFCADFSKEMLREGVRRRGAPMMIAAAAEADALPFSDASFGLVTVMFAARNLMSRTGLLERSLAEIRRVLRPGGAFVNLETSQPRSAPARKMLHAYAGTLVGRLGTALTGERDGYRYLSGSIRSFPGPEDLAEAIRGAGFADVRWKGLMLGAVSVHTAVP